jgi:hypothetical protein
LDQQKTELDNIKANFAIDKEKLVALSGEMSEQDHRDAMQKLALEEQNLLRETELKIQSAHKTEEATLRADLEK